MNREARELLGAWALDAVDDVERRVVERAIAEDEELAAEARALRETVARLAQADAMPAPQELREKVLAQVATAPQRGSAGPSANPGISRRRGSRWWLTAAAAVAVLIPTGIAVQQADRAGTAEDELREFTEALARPDAELLSTEITGGGRAAALVSQEEVLFAASAVPELGEDSTYQLWVIDEGGPSSAGVLGVVDGRLEARLEALPPGGALAMTVEPAGGSPQPTSDPILILGG